MFLESWSVGRQFWVYKVVAPIQYAKSFVALPAFFGQ